MSSDGKWSCEYCTYENFPVSKKCILCRAQRPLQVISDLENSEQDIYKVAELAARNTSNPTASNKDTDAKWTCSMCTFVNWSNVSTCAECRVKRNLNICPTSPCRDRSRLPSVKSTKLSVGNMSSGATTPVKVSPTTPEAAQAPAAGNNDINKAVAAYVKNTIKWACKACTYENWPRNKSCTMCGTPRGKNYQHSDPVADSASASTSSRDDKFALHVETINQENIKSGQNSPMSPLNQNIMENRSGQNSPQNNRSGQNSPVSNNNRSGQVSPVNVTASQIGAPNRQNSGEASPNNRSGQSSPNTNNKRSGHMSPSSRSGQTSPNGSSGQSSPITVQAGAGNREKHRNRNRTDNRADSFIIQDGASAMGGQREESHERRIQKMRKKLSDADLLWLNACEAIVHGDPSGIELFLTSGGDPSRQLTKEEVYILDRPSAFEVGYTLVHIAIRFRRDDMVAVLLTATDLSSKGFKRLPSYASPDIASDIRREISLNLRQRKGNFPCFFLMDSATFSLPADIEDLPRHIQNQLFEELLDSDVDKEMSDDFVINWSLELTEKLGSRLYALWNRTAGDCLLDSVLQATWGILDIDNCLRRALSDSLLEAAMNFYPQWKEYESMQAHSMNFSLDEGQWQRDWAVLLSIASQPGASLEQLHIFVLAHILRRPIIVYGVKVVKSFRGESIDFARFEGVYLPLLWEKNFCFKTPIALGYTRGHFSALVPMEIDTDIPIGAGANIDNMAEEQIAYLPLVDHEGRFLPIHFVTGTEMGQEETILRRWLECWVTPDGHFVAIQKIGKRPQLVKQMIEIWLDYYRQQAHNTEDCTETGLQAEAFSSDGESDQE